MWTTQKNKNVKFVGCILLLSKVLPHLHALGRIFQHDHACYSTLLQMIDATKQHIANNTTELINELAQLLHDGKVTSHNQVELQNTAIQYCATLRDNINRRFNGASPVLEAFSVFDPVCLLQTKYASFKTYSHEHVSTLCKLFGFDEDEARAQWDNFKVSFRNGRTLKGNVSLVAQCLCWANWLRNRMFTIYCRFQ